jgi:hypothetical protein
MGCLLALRRPLPRASRLADWKLRLGVATQPGKVRAGRAVSGYAPGPRLLFPRPLLVDADTGRSRVIVDGNFDLLGSPVGSSEYCTRYTQERVQKVAPTLAALGDFWDPQITVRLLRHCSSFGKLVYSARSTPPLAHNSALKEYDAYVRETFVSAMGFVPTEPQWAQATRGLWVRRAWPQVGCTAR